MGYSTKSGRWAATQSLVLAASAARTATGNGSAVEVGDKAVARLLLDVTARTGTTPTLDVTIQTSFDGTTWRTAGTFTQVTATGQQRLTREHRDQVMLAIQRITNQGKAQRLQVHADLVRPSGFQAAMHQAHRLAINLAGGQATVMGHRRLGAHALRYRHLDAVTRMARHRRIDGAGQLRQTPHQRQILALHAARL